MRGAAEMVSRIRRIGRPRQSGRKAPTFARPTFRPAQTPAPPIPPVNSPGRTVRPASLPGRPVNPHHKVGRSKGKKKIIMTDAAVSALSIGVPPRP